MKERKLTVNLVWANVFCIAVLAVIAILSILLWQMLWSDVDVSAAIREARGNVIEMVVIMIAVVGGIFVHELIHGVTWAHYAENGWKSISFGVVWKMLTPYCHCNEPLKVHPYIVGGLMPLIVLGILPWVIGLCTGNIWFVLYGVFFIVAASGDILIVWKLHGENPSSTVLDHPTEAGCIIYDEG